MATSSPLGDVTDIFSKLLPIFTGTGKTLSTESGSPQANADTQNVIDQATANANNPALTDQLVQNIMRQASESFAPVVAQQQAGGMYNTSTLNLLKNDAMSRATAQASQAVLNYRTSQQQIAEAASGKLLAANQSKVSRTTANPGSSTLAYLGAGLSGAKLINNSGLLDPAKSAVKNALGFGSPAPAVTSGIQTPDAATAERLIGNNGPGGVDASASFDPTYSDPGGLASDTGGGIGTGFGVGGIGGAASGASSVATTQAINIGDAAANGFGDTATSLAETTGTGLNTLTSGTGAVDAADSFAAANAAEDTAGGTFGEASTSAGGDTAAVGTDVAADAGGDAGFGASDLTTTTGTGVGAVGSALGIAGSLSGNSDVAEAGRVISQPQVELTDAGGDAVGGEAGSDLALAGRVAADVVFPVLGVGDAISSAVGSIICTELKKQTKLSMKLWIMCGKEYAKYPDIIKRGYYFYAIPAVRHMRQYPDGRLSRLLERLLKCRANWVAAKYGTYGATKTVGGFCVFHGLNIVGRITGFFVRDMPDWQSVYRTQEQH